ncbi:hypothetical protein ABIB75_008128 [Bradyrhizobium sp. GM2.2]
MPGLHVGMRSNGDTETAAAAQLPHAVETSYRFFFFPKISFQLSL